MDHLLIIAGIEGVYWMRLSVSVIILWINLLLKLLEGFDLEHAVLEGDGVVILVSKQGHYLVLATALQSGLEGLGETEVVEVVGSTTSVLSVRYFALVLDGPPSEEVVAMEEPVGPNADAGQPDRSYSPQPPRVGLCDEVRVVKHLITNQLNYTHLYSLPPIETPNLTLDAPSPSNLSSYIYHCLYVPATTSIFLLW